MSATDEVGNAGEGIGNAFTDAAASTKNGKDTLRKLETAFNDLNNVVSKTGSAFLNSSQEFKKYNQVLDAANLSAKHAIKGIKGGKTKQAISLFASATTGLLKAFFDFNDTQLATYDRLSKLGINATISADKVQDLMNQTSFWYGRFDGFMNSVDALGTGLITLGNTTGEGTKKLAEVLNTADVEDTFIRMGYSIEGLASAQTDYIKLQELSGIKITTDATVLRRESLEYASSLKYLSALTGENVEKLSQEIAEQSLDFKFQLRLTEVDPKARLRLQMAATISSKMFGPEIGASVRDLLANGFASMKKSEGLVILTDGKIGDWVDQLNNGTLSELEFTRNIGNSIKTFETNQRGNLRLSEIYRTEMGINTRSVAGGIQISTVATEEELKALMNTMDEKQQKEGALKTVQTAQIKAEREAGHLTGNVLKVVSGPLTSAFTVLAGLVKQVALISAKLGNYILGEQTEAFEEVIKLLGTPAEVKGLTTDLDSSIAKIKESIKTQQNLGRITKDAKQKAEQAQAKERELQSKITSGQQVSPNEMRSAQDSAREATAIYEDQKRQEKRQFGSNTEELERKQANLERRRADIPAAVQRREEEQRQREAGAISKERADKVIQFSGGVTGDFAHFAQVDPALAEKVIRLAEKYFEMTGKKLNLSSGYRSEAEQMDMYNAWVAAGGNADNKKVHTEKYGNLYMPGKTSKHTSRGAVDIDDEQLKQLGDQVLRSFGLYKPHSWDDVHIEALPGAMNGGIFDGPSSGYPMLFHGTEAIVPLLDNKTMAINLKNASADPSFDSIRESMTKIQEINQASSGTSRRQSNKTIANGLIDQIDSLISQVSQSNSIYGDIKLYMST